jgi:protein tyrosine/serine phosphatase
MRARRRLAWILASAALLGGAFGGWYCVQRYWLSNFHTVVEGQLYRSGHPREGALADWIGRYGIKTVVDLSDGADTSYYAAERAAVQQAGAVAVNHQIRPKELPSAGDLRRLIEIVETSPRPVLVHCEAGAQRTGLASVIGAMALGGQDYAAARGQMSIKYLLFYRSRDNVDGVLYRYEDYCRQKAIDTAGWQRFRQWALNDYQPPD